MEVQQEEYSRRLKPKKMNEKAKKLDKELIKKIKEDGESKYLNEESDEIKNMEIEDNDLNNEYLTKEKNEIKEVNEEKEKDEKNERENEEKNDIEENNEENRKLKEINEDLEKMEKEYLEKKKKTV